MPIISVEIMKIADEREMKKKTTKKQINKDRKEQGRRKL